MQQDSDADGTIDHCDRCPGLDDELDIDGNAVPDCLEFQGDELLCGAGGFGTMMPLLFGLMLVGVRRRR